MQDSRATVIERLTAKRDAKNNDLANAEFEIFKNINLLQDAAQAVLSAAKRAAVTVDLLRSEVLALDDEIARVQ